MVTKTPVGTIHVIAQCGDCTWRNEDFIKAEQAARQHAETTGHTVSVERGQCWKFNPKN